MKMFRSKKNFIKKQKVERTRPNKKLKHKRLNFITVIIAVLSQIRAVYEDDEVNFWRIDLKLNNLHFTYL